MAEREALPLADLRFKKLDPDLPLARLALASLMAPLQAATPEKAAKDAVRVFLKWPRDVQAEADAALARRDALLAQMALIWETELAVSRLRQAWPKTVAEAGRRMPELEREAALLNDLWEAALANAGSGPGGSGWGGFRGMPESVPILLAMAREGQSGIMALLDKALELIAQRQAHDGQNRALWALLGSEALRMRAQEHERRGESGLAEADLSTALFHLRGVASSPALAPLRLARAQLRARKGDGAGMCADLEAACALGQCEGLSLAKRRGQCVQPQGQAGQ